MSKIEEMLRDGKPPGYAGVAKDPTCADMAVPRALKEIEQTKGAREIVREMGWKPTTRNLNEIRRTWNV